MDRWSEIRESLHAPTLLPYEAASALSRMARDGRLPPSDVPTASRLISGLRIELHGVVDLTTMVQVALRLQRQSAYDASYLVLARELDAELWTLDGPLARNASGLGFRVQLITS
jgi:predicted nucleic acid-binding protein